MTTERFGVQRAVVTTAKDAAEKLAKTTGQDARVTELASLVHMLAMALEDVLKQL